MNHLFSILFIVIVSVHINVNAQIGVDTVSYQWSGSYCGGGVSVDATSTYTFYPNGPFSLKFLHNSNLENDSGTWVIKKKIIILNPEKKISDYVYQGKFRYHKNNIKWILGPLFKESYSKLGYWWSSLKWGHKYKKVK